MAATGSTPVHGVNASVPPGGVSRRSVLLGLAAAPFVSAGLAGCVGQGSGAPSAVTTGAEAATTALPPSDVTTTLQFLSYQSPQPQWTADAITAFRKQFPNVTVQSTSVPFGEMTAKLLGSGLSGSIADAVFFNPADAAKIYQAGIIGDMTPYWNGFADQGQFPDSVIWKTGDKILSVQGYVNIHQIWYNKTILDKVGVAVPQSMEDFDAALKAVHAGGFGGFLLPGAPSQAGEAGIMPWMYAYGQDYGRFDQPTVEKVFTMFDRWLQAGYIPRDITNNIANDNYNIFTNGNYAFVQNGNWNVVGAEKKLTFDWGVTSFPEAGHGSHPVPGGEGFAIGSKTAYPPLVFKFFESMLLTQAKEIEILNQSGSLPARADTSSAPEIQADPRLLTYAKAVKTMGVRPNTTNLSDLIAQMGKTFNAVAGGALTPAAAAATVVAKLNSV